MVRKDLTGQRFGRLTVLERAPNIKRYTAWLCVCDCGTRTVVRTDHLSVGHSQSCGCFNRERVTTHGKGNTRLYLIWTHMISRCNNKNEPNYGGRGIAVCDEWKNEFLKFYDWAMQNGYSDDLTIDRKNVDGNYEPGNCSWASDKEQSRNKRNNTRVLHKGNAITLAELAEVIGINPSTVYTRYHRGFRSEALLQLIKG